MDVVFALVFVGALALVLGTIGALIGWWVAPRIMRAMDEEDAREEAERGVREAQAGPTPADDETEGQRG